jgi:uncharacterized protein YegL
MNRNLTDITVVLDRSGSMQKCRADAEGGINSFINDQKAKPGECNFSMVEFDTNYNFVHKGVPISSVPPYKLVPGGWTALLDAVGRAIDETGSRLAATPEHARPGLVVFVIVTDGEENSSKEYTLQQIKQKIEHQQSAYNWQFTFLGANQDAFLAGASIGVRASGVAQYDVNNAGSMFAAASSNVSRMRKMSESGITVDNYYTTQERSLMS